MYVHTTKYRCCCVPLSCGICRLVPPFQEGTHTKLRSFCRVSWGGAGRQAPKNDKYVIVCKSTHTTRRSYHAPQTTLHELNLPWVRLHPGRDPRHPAQGGGGGGPARAELLVERRRRRRSWPVGGRRSRRRPPPPVARCCHAVPLCGRGRVCRGVRAGAGAGERRVGQTLCQELKRWKVGRQVGWQGREGKVQGTRVLKKKREKSVPARARARQFTNEMLGVNF